MKARNRFVFTVIAITIGLGAGIFFIVIYLINEDMVSSQPLSIIAVGDSIGYNVKGTDLNHLPILIGDADIFLFNLEGVVIDSAHNLSKCKALPNQSILQASSSFLEFMRLGQITIGSLANNHVLDCGPEGLDETKENLERYNILSVGAGLDIDESCEPLIVNVKNRRLAFVSYNFIQTDFVSADISKAGTAVFDACQHDYDEIRTQGADIIIASVHNGLWSLEGKVSEEQLKLVNKLFDGGVDIVIGHSPHIPQSVMVRDGKVAFFSLGNFVFRPDIQMPALAHTAIFSKLEIYPERIEVAIYPIILDSDGIPHLDDTEEILSRVALLSKKFDTNLETRGNIGYLSIPR